MFDLILLFMNIVIVKVKQHLKILSTIQNFPFFIEFLYKFCIIYIHWFYYFIIEFHSFDISEFS